MGKYITLFHFSLNFNFSFFSLPGSVYCCLLSFHHWQDSYPVKDKPLTTSGSSHTKALHYNTDERVVNMLSWLLHTYCCRLFYVFKLLKKHQQILLSHVQFRKSSVIFVSFRKFSDFPGNHYESGLLRTKFGNCRCNLHMNVAFLFQLSKN